MDLIIIIVSVLLVTAILVQQRGTGTSGIFGGSQGGFYGQRRGTERIIFIATIILAITFIGLSLLTLTNR